MKLINKEATLWLRYGLGVFIQRLVCWRPYLCFISKVRMCMCMCACVKER